MNDLALRIMIIDDNLAIHNDFIKVLTTQNTSRKLLDLDNIIFSEDEDNIQVPDNPNLLPNFIFETASQGQEGVAKIKEAMEKGERYVLAFVDVRMPPGWDGIETIKRIWELDPHIQAVICTAYSDYTWEETIDKLGMSDNFLILKKPFDLVAVRQLACALTKKWLLAEDQRKYMQLLQKTVDTKTESLEKYLGLLRETIELSTDAILVVDYDKQNVIEYNNKLFSIWGISENFLKHNSYMSLFEYFIDQLDNAEIFLDMLSFFDKNVNETQSQQLKFKSGKVIECYSQPHYLNNKIIGRVWSFRDITEQVKLENKLEYQASHDALTGLPNRVLLIDRINKLIEIAKKNQQSFGVIFLDLDRFKLINDSLTHKVGDELLVQIAKRVAALVRKEDTLARLSGDEFILVIPNLVKEIHIIPILNKILDSFKTPFIIANKDISITPSMGVSFYPNNGTTTDRLLQHADLAMYQSKEGGGNQYQFYAKKLNKQAKKRFKLEASLHRAIKNKEFILYYQPQYNIKNRSLLSVEALIRWQSPEKGLILPMDFIPSAEESGLIIPIGEWVIKEVCQQLKTWKEKGYPPLLVAVNVAMQQLKQHNFDEYIKKCLIEYDIDPQYLELEITENVIITHPDVINMINKLKAIGIRIVLDDFGAGNSSLSYLKSIHFDRLKIDQTFVKNIVSSHTDRVIIEAIISMAKSFNFKILAEGVETENQMEFLKKKKCEEVQGFLLSKPLTKEQIETFLKRKK